MSNRIYKYRTRDGRGYFSFRYVEIDGQHYDVDIVKYPNYRGRDEDSHTAHWLYSERYDVERKICFAVGKEPNSLKQAQKFSTQWAEYTWTYVLTNMTIDEQLLRKN